MTPIKPEILADVLADSREYIEKHGWWRGALIGPNHQQVCAVGAVMMSQGWDTALSRPLREAVILNAIEKVVLPIAQELHQDRGVDSIPYWNDDLAKDKQEILDVFAKAEKILRAGFDPDAS